jgi:hypothetical protein
LSTIGYTSKLSHNHSLVANMVAAAVQNPEVRSESKSAKKKKAKLEAAAASSPQPSQPSPSAPESSTGEYESPYIKELYK